MTKPPLWTPDELARLWWGCAHCRGLIGDVQARYWWLSLACLVWETKQHPTDILDKLEWNDLPLDRLHPSALEPLDKVRRPGVPVVLTWPLAHVHLWASWKRIIRDAGIPDDKSRSFRCLMRCAREYPRFVHPADLPVPADLKGGLPCVA